MTGGESLWRANGRERADPFADVGARRQSRPRLARAARAGSAPAARQLQPPNPQRVIEARASSAVSLGNKGRDRRALGQRVFHQKFGYGTIAEIEGNKLEIDFEQAGRKRVMDSFVTVAISICFLVLYAPIL